MALDFSRFDAALAELKAELERSRHPSEPATLSADQEALDRRVSELEALRAQPAPAAGQAPNQLPGELPMQLPDTTPAPPADATPAPSPQPPVG